MLPDSHHGPWTGTNRLWLDPDGEPEVSDATAEVGPDTLSYTWSRADQAHQGTYAFTREQDTVLATFTDSFHTGSKPMACMGPGSNDRISVTGAYAAPPGADWGWRTEVDTSRADAVVLRMFNLSPDGGEDRAVEITLHR